MTIQKINTFKIALDCVYHDANLTAYQLYPEVFQWMKMNNYINHTQSIIDIDNRVVKFMTICFDYGADLGTAANFMVDFYNDIMAIADAFSDGIPDAMRIKKADRPKTSAFKEMISLN